MSDKKSNSERPTFSGGLKKGYEQSREMWSTPRGKLTSLILLGSMFWLFFLAPATCMKLDEAFPHTKANIGLIVGLAMYLLWIVLLVLSGQFLRRRRNIRLFGKPKPSFKEAMPYMKEQVRQVIKEIKKADY